MLNPLGDVASGLEMVVKGQMDLEESRGLLISSWMLFPQFILKTNHYISSYMMS